MDTLLTILGSNVFVAVISYVTGKRKSQAETDNQVLRNLELSVNLYKQIIDDLKTEIEGLNIRIQELEKKIDELHEENKILKGYGKSI
jgi:peptidoglycan hydrolase CwlO-like protein